MFSVSLRTYVWSISLLSLLLAFQGVYTFNAVYHGTRFHNKATLIQGVNRISTIRKLERTRAPFHFLRSQLNDDENSKQILLDKTMTAVLQSVGLYPAGRNDAKSRVVFENEQNSSLRIEAWGDDESETLEQDDNKTLFLWLPGLDGTSKTGEYFRNRLG
jgi:hypothetical protein